jgi:hypothetical protein
MADKKQPKEEKTLGFKEQLIKNLTIDFTDLGTAIENSYRIQVNLNEAFGQGQERLSEMMKTVSDTIPRITRLGGDITDVQTTMLGIASASRRNVISNTEDIEKLYAATQVVGGSAKELTNAFLNVGIGIGEVGTQLENSVNYVRSIGGNTKDVMEDVRLNMDQMNRFQFEGGVRGLTKMAAQASMLRFDMSNTFSFAERVLKPEDAIDVASAFQRLGVMAGNLADPFQLMNMSINDPSGLQNSLAEVSKQFTYFDEETKSFKINPQGVLTLREMEEAAGLARGSLSKMGLAAAELDERVSAINNAGLTIASEEDKQYLANIATMKDGKYMVTLEDDTTKELSQLNQDEFDKLIEQQKTGPKTLEDIVRLQLGIDESILADTGAIKKAITQGLTSPKQIREGISDFQKVTKTIGGEASNIIGTEDFRKISDSFMETVKIFGKDFILGDKDRSEVISEGLSGIGNILSENQGIFTEKLESGFNGIIEKLSKDGIDTTILDNVKSFITGPITSNSVPQNSLNIEKKILETETKVTSNQTTNSKVDVGGTINFNFDAIPTGVSTEDVAKIMNKTFNSQLFQEYISKIPNQNNPKQPLSMSYS